jgi:4-hydroxy 2-oxovalerate aldolase
LAVSGIDIIEIGFLRTGQNVEYRGNSTYFTEISQISSFIPKDRHGSEFVVFTDYGAQYKGWDFGKITPCDNTSVTGFRVGYRKEDLCAAIDTFKVVKDNGYKLFIQGVESLNYTDKEMLVAIEIINEIKPYAFGVVDTYGSMYKDDVLRLLGLVDHNLSNDIAIDFHSHNNLQLSFSFAQEVVEAVSHDRTVLLDATLHGIGGGAGNLNTELIADYLNRKHGYHYDLDAIFDAIDEYILWIKQDEDWGYSIPHFFAGIYTAHANNITYLLEKHRLDTKDIRYILNMLEPKLRKRYDYNLLEKLYIEYSNNKIDDSDAIGFLKEQFANRSIMVIAPGKTVQTEADAIKKAIADSASIIISINHLTDMAAHSFVFYGNYRKYKHDLDHIPARNCIISSNIKSDLNGVIKVDYNHLIDRDLFYADNPTVMLLNLLYRIGVKNILIAGLDGFKGDISDYYDSSYEGRSTSKDYEAINKDLYKFLKEYRSRLGDSGTITFVTTSMFDEE